jgi:hypothetical protein
MSESQNSSASQAVPASDFWTAVSEHSTELQRLRKLLDSTFAGGATETDRAEDRVVFPLLVSCRDISEEILFLISEQFGKAAFRAVRTMYECLVTAHYLHLHPDKTDDFLSKFHVQWAKIRQSFPHEVRNTDFDKDLTDKVPKYRSGKFVTTTDLNWSGSHVHEMAKEAGHIADLHAVAFDHASAYIHPSTIFLVRMFSASGTDKSRLKIGMRSEDTEARLALRVGHDLLLNAVALRMKYVGTEEQKTLFEVCKLDFQNIWGYQPHI